MPPILVPVMVWALTWQSTPFDIQWMFSEGCSPKDALQYVPSTSTQHIHRILSRRYHTLIEESGYFSATSSERVALPRSIHLALVMLLVMWPSTLLSVESF